MTPVYLSRPGVVTCAGAGLESLWRAVVNADSSGIKRVRALSGKEFYAGVVDDELLPTGRTKIVRMTEAALQQLDSGIQTAIARYGAHRVAVCAGSCDNGADSSLAAHAAFVRDGFFPAGYTLEMQGAAEGAAYIASKYSITGPALSFATACSSSATAMMRGAQLLLSGAADAVVAGGVDRASDIALLGFDSLEAVSGEKSNPFSVNRRGITLGDGASFFLLTQESLCDMPHTAPIMLMGMGETCDAHHMTAPDDTGEYAACAMMNALESAGAEASEVDYVNLHGTGTRQNDAMESRAMQKVFGENGVKCSSTKSITGHTLGAAGAVEAAVCYAALTMNSVDEASLPAQSWDGEADPSLPGLDIVDKDGTVKHLDVCMTNTFAFGGANASLIIGRETWKK